jgi:protoheme IX farnesyltransferase
MTSVADQPVDVVSVPPRSAVAVFRSYLALTKPKIIRQLLVTTVPAMFLAARGLPGLWTVVATLVGGALAAGSANSLNCYVDRDIDQVMTRTARRPLAQHTVAPTAALVFGIALGMVSVVFLWVTTNFLAAVLALAAILFYVLVYTMGLKRRTSQNIVWGGAAGCMPVLIGWAAVTGSLAWPAWVLFAVIFFWTPPHFWALAMKYKDDYAAAGVPMLPVVASPRRVAFEIVAYSWVMVATSLVLWPLATSWIYGVSALLAGVWFLVEAHRLRAQVVSAGVSGAEVNSMRLFHVSISYLTVLFVAVAVDALIS